jgi:hypothetical protein
MTMSSPPTTRRRLRVRRASYGYAARITHASCGIRVRLTDYASIARYPGAPFGFSSPTVPASTARCDFRVRCAASVQGRGTFGDDAKVRRLDDAEHLTIPVVHDAAGLVAQRLNTVGVPKSYLFDGDGRLVWHQVGGLHENTSGAREAVELALRNQ